MTNAGAVVKVEDKQTITEIVNEAVGGSYTPAYVAAMKELLPPEFHNAPSLIALGVRARKSGLDPFTEIHAWKNERGKLQFQIARDGFIFIAANDPNVESLEFQHVYEGEQFSWSKDSDGKVLINHSGGLVKGKLLGAYCVAHMAGDLADHMEMRTVDNYSHLMSKPNWKYLPEMLITRVIGATVRLVCPDRAGGLYSEADNELAEVASVAEHQASRAQSATEAKIAKLTEPAQPMDEAEEDTVFVDLYSCPECERTFDSQQGLAGHMRAHKKEEPDPTPEPVEPEAGSPNRSPTDTSGAKEGVEVEVPEGFTVYQAGAWAFEVVDPDGQMLDATFRTYNDAALAAQNVAFERENDAPNAVEPVQPEVKLADLYAWCRLNSVPVTAVRDTVNADEHAELFSAFKGEGNINVFDLDAAAYATLLELLKEAHG